MLFRDKEVNTRPYKSFSRVKGSCLCRKGNKNYWRRTEAGEGEREGMKKEE